MSSKQIHDDWWRSFHVAEMADLFLERDGTQELAETVRFLTQSLHLKSGSHVYDQCCGIGTLSLALARTGIHATGADLCDMYIQRARDGAEQVNQPSEFFCEDAFTFVPSEPCDGVFNWYSSFGYADTDQRNAQMLQCAFESLVPGGWFALDVPHFPGLIRGFQKHLVRRGISQGRQVTCIRESQVDLESGQLRQTWSWMISGEQTIERKSSLRIYWPHQIREMLLQAGFENIQLFGGIDRSDLSLDSLRLICVAQRPENV